MVVEHRGPVTARASIGRTRVVDSLDDDGPQLAAAGWRRGFV
jgi:hypothetical protein